MVLGRAFKSRSISCNKSDFRAGHGPGYLSGWQQQVAESHGQRRLQVNGRN